MTENTDTPDVFSDVLSRNWDQNPPLNEAESGSKEIILDLSIYDGYRL